MPGVSGQEGEVSDGRESGTVWGEEGRTPMMATRKWRLY